MEKATCKATEGGKFLTFFLGTEEYALEILKVQEIIGMAEITTIPGSSRYVRGVINLRGRIIPVIDLRSRFGMVETNLSSDSCIIVVDVGDSKTGIVVDSVSDVMNICADQIEPVPTFGSETKESFLLGIGKTDGGVKLLLDIDRLLADARPLESDLPITEGR